MGSRLAFYFPVARWGSLVEVTSCPDLDFVSDNRGFKQGFGSVLEKISYWKVFNGTPNKIDFFFPFLVDHKSLIEQS